MADDDNSQDYKGYKRAAENDLTEEPSLAGKDEKGLEGDKTEGSGDTEESEDDDEEEYKDSGARSSLEGVDSRDGDGIKDPKDWTTGDEPATAAQKSYINTMAVEAKEEVPFELTKAEASEKIHELQLKTGRDDSTERP